MATRYITVFQVSYFSNGTLFFSAVALFASLFAFGVASVLWGRLSAGQAEAARKQFFYFRLVPSILAGLSSIWLGSNIYDGYRFTHVLKDGRCRVVEGTVHVIRDEPWSGRGGGIIQIADKKFGIVSHQDKLSYRGTGLLVEGIIARIHYLGNDMLKVEIAE